MSKFFILAIAKDDTDDVEVDRDLLFDYYAFFEPIIPKQMRKYHVSNTNNGKESSEVGSLFLNQTLSPLLLHSIVITITMNYKQEESQSSATRHRKTTYLKALRS